MKTIQLSKAAIADGTTEYIAAKDIGEPKEITHNTPLTASTGMTLKETIYILRAGRVMTVDDGYAEELRKTWGWRLDIKDA